MLKIILVAIYSLIFVGVHGNPRPEYNYPAPSVSINDYATSSAHTHSKFYSSTVQKHIYVYHAPNEAEISIPKTIPVQPKQTHYKIIFIKAPTAPTPTAPVIPVQHQDDHKTLVYVLVKKAEEQPDVHIPTAIPTTPSKPEVYFIRYKGRKKESTYGLAEDSSSSSKYSLSNTSYGPPSTKYSPPSTNYGTPKQAYASGGLRGG